MFKRFLSGIMISFPFVALFDKDIKYFPEEIFKNDWKTIGTDIRNIVTKKKDLKDE